MQEKGPLLRGNCYLLIMVAIKYYMFMLRDRNRKQSGPKPALLTFQGTMLSI